MDDASKSRFFCSIKLSGRDVILVNGLLLLCLAIYILLYLGASKIQYSNYLFEYRDILIYILWTIVVSIVFKWKLKDYTFVGLTSRNILRNTLFGLVIILLYLSVKISTALIFKMPLVSVLEKGLLEYSSKPLAVFVFHGCVSITIAPVLEEVIFRGFIYPPLRKKIGVVLGIIVCALIFSVWHIGASLKGVINLFIVGVIFGYLYERSSSLLPSITVHIILNLNYLLFVIIHILDMQRLVKLPTLQIYAIVLATYLGLATIVYFFYRKQTRTCT